MTLDEKVAKVIDKFHAEQQQFSRVEAYMASIIEGNKIHDFILTREELENSGPEYLMKRRHIMEDQIQTLNDLLF